jgi:hypothetical protein
MRKGLAIGTAVLLAALYFISPYWALAGLSRAALDHRLDDFESYMDVASLKADVSRHLRIQANANGQPLASISEIITAGAIEKLVSPEALSSIFASNLAPYSQDSRLKMTWGLMTESTIRWIHPGRVSLGTAGSMRRTALSWKFDHFAEPAERITARNWLHRASTSSRFASAS